MTATAQPPTDPPANAVGAPRAVPLGAAAIVARVATLRAAATSGHARPLAWRRAQLRALVAMLRDHEAELADALRSDLGKPVTEGYLTDVAFVVDEVRSMLSNLGRWNREVRVPTPLILQPSRSRLVPEPLGMVLVIAPWNYPVQLLLVPAAGAIAAGNTVMLKPSELASATSALLARLVPQYLDQAAVGIVEGGPAETTVLLEQRWDHIFFTGNATVARVVMTAAAKHLTPVTLELGGKSPAVVDASADVRLAARRIAWGKWLNAGQTCVAPDYVLVHRSIRDAFVEEVRRAVVGFYGPDPQRSDAYGRIIDDRHVQRLLDLLSGGTVVVGGECDPADRYLAPTVLVDVDPDSALMQDEIFGPLLPVLDVDCIDEAIATIGAKPKPLALYVFARDVAVQRAVIERTSAGGVTVNGTIVHLLNPRLPFGGVGDSGMGAYHGEAGVRVFQHRKPVLSRLGRLDPSIAYPPYGRLKSAVLRRLF